jgi:hypothetical protein
MVALLEAGNKRTGTAATTRASSGRLAQPAQAT